LNWPDCKEYDEKLLERLCSFAEDRKIPIVLYCLSDEAIAFANKYRRILSNHYLFQLPEACIVDHILSKTKFTQLMKRVGVACPVSQVLNGDNIEEVAESFPFPAVLKLALQKSWKFNPDLSKDYHKVKVVENQAALRYWFGRLKRYDEVLIQELIPGPSGRLFYCTVYRPATCRKGIIFTGQKIRTATNGFGSETFYRSVKNDKLERICAEVLEKLDYVGFGGIDFKYDERDGSYKLIEINARLGISDGLAIECGLDLPYYHYQNVTGQSWSYPTEYAVGKVWVWLSQDLEHYDWDRGVMSIFDWLSSLMANERSYAVWDIYDFRPFLEEWLGVSGRLSRYALSRLR
jgi:predicted ATP-grasp superfamily ATP-dependent carboligase